MYVRHCRELVHQVAIFLVFGVPGYGPPFSSDVARHLLWDTKNNGTPILSRTKSSPPIVAVLGQLKGHTKQTWCTSLELNWSFYEKLELIMRMSRNIYFGTLTMYIGTLARTSRDENITPILLARLQGILNPWSQHKFQRKTLRRHQAQISRVQLALHKK